MDGSQFKQLLMDRFAIQVNKTSRNTILLLTHIGTTPATGAHLVKALTQIASDLDEQLADQSQASERLHRARVTSLTRQLPPLPHFSRFHRSFLPDPESRTPEGDMRRAFFLAYDAGMCDHVTLDEALVERVSGGEEVVSASFVTPYPPGFPVLVPGQVMSREILVYLRALDVKEIHGYRPEFGLRVFRPDALVSDRAAEGAPASMEPGREDAEEGNGVPVGRLAEPPRDAGSSAGPRGRSPEHEREKPAEGFTQAGGN
jgi:arginine decarboxylase